MSWMSKASACCCGPASTSRSAAPMETGPSRVADDGRILAAPTSIEELRRQGARLVRIWVLGRPQGRDRALSMRPVAERLGALSGVEVPLAPAVIGTEVHELTGQLAPGQMLMLKNARFEPGETRNDPAFAVELAELYVDDAFATAHHPLASNAAVARWLTSGHQRGDRRQRRRPERPIPDRVALGEPRARPRGPWRRPAAPARRSPPRVGGWPAPAGRCGRARARTPTRSPRHPM